MVIAARILFFLADRGSAVPHSPDWISVGANKEGKAIAILYELRTNSIVIFSYI
jgi:hypothetical protein